MLLGPLFVCTLSPSGATAQSKKGSRISFDSQDLDFGEANESFVCWAWPQKKLRKATRQKLKEAFEEAGQATTPEHAPERITATPVGRTFQSDCRVHITMTYKGRRKNVRLSLTATERGSQEILAESQLKLDIRKLAAADFRPFWASLWQKITPPPPPPKPVAAPSSTKTEESFVDEELAQELALANHKPTRPSYPILTAYLGVGYATRSLKDAPGTPVGRSNLLSVAVETTLHLAPRFGLSESHDLDFELAYVRGLASGKRGDEDLRVDADRFRLGARYRFQLGHPWLPRLGPVVGYELLRFEVDRAADALSVRYTALRLGVSMSQPLYRTQSMLFFGPAELSLGIEGSTRLALGDQADKADLGFDLQGGPELRFYRGLVAKLLGRYTRHTTELSGRSVKDTYFDLSLNLGWTL